MLFRSSLSTSQHNALFRCVSGLCVCVCLCVCGSLGLKVRYTLWSFRGSQHDLTRCEKIGHEVVLERCLGAVAWEQTAAYDWTVSNLAECYSRTFGEDTYVNTNIQHSPHTVHNRITEANTN